VQIDKSTIIEYLRSQGDQDKAQQADEQLPDQVDTERHSDVLERLGINPDDLLGGLGGKVPGL